MDSFKHIVREIYEPLTSGIAIPVLLKEREDSEELIIPAQHENGFDISLECYEYGIYASSSVGWHGSCWDRTVIEREEAKELVSEFIESILNNAVLEVYYSNGKLYKSRLNFQSEGSEATEEMTLVFFNWFGKKTKRRLCNGELQSNKSG